MITKQNFVAILSLIVLDFLWIYFYMSNKYQKLILHIQNKKLKINLYYVLGAYLLMIYLLINVVLKYNMSLIESFMFGFSIYGIYDMTCGALFINWNFNLAIIDMIWGGFVYMISAYIAKQF
jgi:uncharacterized membrane protein